MDHSSHNNPVLDINQPVSNLNQPIANHRSQNPQSSQNHEQKPKQSSHPNQNQQYQAQLSYAYNIFLDANKDYKEYIKWEK